MDNAKDKLIPPNWNPHDFSKEELMMIQQVFQQATFPGQTCGAIGRFLLKVENLIRNYDGPAINPLAVDQEKGKG